MNNQGTNGVDLSDRAAELEWFIKGTAVEAVNDSNKDEFNKILDENNSMGLAEFIKKYVPDFKDKFVNFLKKYD